MNSKLCNDRKQGYEHIPNDVLYVIDNFFLPFRIHKIAPKRTVSNSVLLTRKHRMLYKLKSCIVLIIIYNFVAVNIFGCNENKL